MKRFLSIALSMVFLLSLCACGIKTPEEPSTPETTLPVQTEPTATEPEQPTEETVEATVSLYTAPMSAVSMPTVKEIAAAEDGTTLFSYTYQNIFPIMQDPAVANTVSLDLLNRIDSTRSAAEDIRESAIADYTESAYWTPYFSSVYYNPMRIDQGILSLVGSKISYQGGAHPTHVSVSVTYDLVTGKALTFEDILSADYSAQDLIDGICAALAEKGDQLYSDYESVIHDRFSGASISTENWYLSTDGLCLYFSPYDIAPYSAGTITAVIAYEDLNGIIKDDYFPTERGSAFGSIQKTAFSDADLSQFTQFAELVLNRDADAYVLYTDGQVFDVRLETGSISGDAFTPISTVFACEALTPSDAVMVQTDDILRLTYLSEGETLYVILE